MTTILWVIASPVIALFLILLFVYLKTQFFYIKSWLRIKRMKRKYKNDPVVQKLFCEIEKHMVTAIKENDII